MTDSVADFKVAQKRIASLGIPFYDARYPEWRHTLRYIRADIADPRRCSLCVLEAAKRVGHKAYLAAETRVLVYGALGDAGDISFRTVIDLHGLSMKHAVEHGFVRGVQDSPTFYASLKSAWRAQYRSDPVMVSRGFD